MTGPIRSVPHAFMVCTRKFSSFFVIVYDDHRYSKWWFQFSVTVECSVLLLWRKRKPGYKIKLTCYCGRYVSGRKRNTVRIVYRRSALEAFTILPSPVLVIYNVIRVCCLKYEHSCQAQPPSSQCFSFSESVRGRFSLPVVIKIHTVERWSCRWLCTLIPVLHRSTFPQP
jgi:hypothetical protein